LALALVWATLFQTENQTGRNTMPLNQLDLSTFTKIGEGVERCEDVVVFKDGRVFCSEQNCGVAELHPDGSFTRIGPKAGAPNGINATPDGKILIANFGTAVGEPGPLEMLNPATGERTILVAEVEGRALTSANYPVMDAHGNIWCANSTDASPWPDALDGRADGYLFVRRPDGTTRIVAEGLRFANGLAIDEEAGFLFCCQTTGANVVRFAILNPGPAATLGPPETYGPQLGALMTGEIDPDNLPPAEVTGTLGYTDGCGLDVEGNLWVTLVAAHKIVAITPDRQVITVLHDPSGEFMYDPTNITFGGADMKDLYIGSLRAPYVLKGRSPVAGRKLVHQL
jgi:gluconolactonase